MTGGFLVQKDFQDVGVHLTEKEIVDMPTSTYKKYIKEKIKNQAFEELNNKLLGHSKIRNIFYSQLDIQAYLINP